MRQRQNEQRTYPTLYGNSYRYSVRRSMEYEIPTEQLWVVAAVMSHLLFSVI